MPAVKFGFFADPDRTPPMETWLDSAGLTLFDRLPPGSGFDRVGYHKAAFSGLRVVGISIKNDAGHVDDALESMKPFARYTQTMQLAPTPATAALFSRTRAIDGESLTALMAAFGART
jgi:hypothetical protein